MIRSQMAEGFARALGGDAVEAYSAGTAPAGGVSRQAAVVMREKGIDITRQWSKGIEDVPIREMDYVITLASTSADEICPPDFAGVKIDWNVRDPLGGIGVDYLQAREEIERRVKELLDEIRESK